AAPTIVQPTPPASAGPPAASWAAAGVGVVALGVFVGFGARAASIQSDLETCAPDCPAARDKEKAEEGQRDATVADVGLVVGGAAVLTAGLLWAFWPRHQDRAHARGTRLSFAF